VYESIVKGGRQTFEAKAIGVLPRIVPNARFAWMKCERSCAIREPLGLPTSYRYMNHWNDDGSDTLSSLFFKKRLSDRPLRFSCSWGPS